MGPRLYAMTCGWLTMPSKLFLSGGEGWLAIPVPSYLIVHPKGTALFDTGLETAFRASIPRKSSGPWESSSLWSNPSSRPAKMSPSVLGRLGSIPTRSTT